MSCVLLLNADWLPLQFITDVRALRLLMKSRAEVITVSDAPSMWNYHYATVSSTFQVPATIRLHLRVSVDPSISRFRKKVLFNRDDWSCQYCNKTLTKNNITIDHIVPKCMGGQTTWRNCVVCCKTCNKNKGAKLPHETNMRLLKQPGEPKIIHFLNICDKKDWHDDWSTFVRI